MSITGHIIESTGRSLYVDLDAGGTAPGTPIIIFPLDQTGGNRNQNWRFILVNPEQNLWNIQNILTAGYASVASPIAGQGIVLSPSAFTWEVVVTDTSSGNWNIKVPDSGTGAGTGLVWTAQAGTAVGTSITIAPSAVSSTNQQWKLTAI